jgi:outer membrane protein assembly factor BamD
MIICGVFILSSCGGSPNITPNLSAEERFEQGKKKFDDGDYLEAINEFDIVKLQYPGSSVADDAQFYLAECRYKREEFLVAAEEYQSLKRNMPASPFVPRAQFRQAMCYYNLNPKSSLDQRYAARAIDEFQSFIEYNPTHELVPEAEAKIKELDARLARKIYDTAVLYMRMEYYKAATICYDNVTEKYHDSPYAEPALLGKARSLFLRKKYQEAKLELAKFSEKYPTSELKKDAESLMNDVNDHLKNKSSQDTSKSDRSDVRGL